MYWAHRSESVILAFDPKLEVSVEAVPALNQTLLVQAFSCQSLQEHVVKSRAPSSDSLLYLPPVATSPIHSHAGSDVVLSQGWGSFNGLNISPFTAPQKTGL